MYETLRDFADSWALIALVVIFVGIVLFVFRRGEKAREHYQDASKIPFREEQDKMDT